MAVELLICATGIGFFALLPVFVIGGFGTGYALVHDRLLLASAAPAAIHGRMFAFQKACASLAFGAAFVAAGVMIGALGVQLTFLVAGLGLVGAMVAMAPPLRRAWPAPAATASGARRKAEVVPQPAASPRRSVSRAT